MKRNQTKLMILTILSEGIFTTSEIYSQLRDSGEAISLASVRMCIHRCKKWALVSASYKVEGSKELKYCLTEKGKSRFEWLKNQRKSIYINELITEQTEPSSVQEFEHKSNM